MSLRSYQKSLLRAAIDWVVWALESEAEFMEMLSKEQQKKIKDVPRHAKRAQVLKDQNDVTAELCRMVIKELLKIKKKFG